MLKTAYNNNGTSRQVHLSGWKKQPRDERDDAYALKLHGAFTARPSSCDLRSICSPIEDQSDLGSCTAQMLAGMVEANQNKKMVKTASATNAATVSVGPLVVNSVNGVISYTTTMTPAKEPTPVVSVSQPTINSSGSLTYTTTVTPSKTPTPSKFVNVSRLFEYYATRKLENTVSQDSGATIRGAIKAAVQYGMADELAWPYDIAKFKVNPPQTVWTSAATHKVTSYHAISDGDLETMKNAIYQGFLVGFGFMVFDYFISSDMAKKGVLHRPDSREQFIGGHAVCLVAYDDTKKTFLARNSWGTSWGQNGYFEIDYNYVSDPRLASDFWVVQSNY